jgi:hypothetical protein
MASAFSACTGSARAWTNAVLVDLKSRVVEIYRE